MSGGRADRIVAKGRLNGVRCVDMLIDTGASCCFIRRSCAERMKLKQLPLDVTGLSLLP